MAKTNLNIRVSAEDYIKIGDDAAEAGLSISNFVRMKLGLPVSGWSARKTVLLAEPVPSLVPAVEKVMGKRARNEMCVHRVQASSYCSRCD